MTDAPTPAYLTKQAFKARGWTDLLVRRLLGDPDKTAVNSHRPSGPRVRLYDPGRVERAEATPEFRDAQERLRPRRQLAAERKALKERARAAEIARGLEMVDAINITVPALARERLIELACAHYNRLRQQRASEAIARRYLDEWQDATPESSPEFLDRIAVNYLRHRATDYDRQLKRLDGFDSDEVALRLKSRILDAIAGRYEWLAEECRRQRARAEAAIWPPL